MYLQCMSPCMSWPPQDLRRREAGGQPLVTHCRPTAVLMPSVAFLFSVPFVCFLGSNIQPVSLSRRVTPSSASTLRPTCSSSAHRGTARQLHSGPRALPFCLPLRVGGSKIVLHLFQFCLSTCITTCSWPAQTASEELGHVRTLLLWGFIVCGGRNKIGQSAI